MSESKELAHVPPRENAMAVFTTAKGLDPYLAHVRAEIDAFKPDLTTKKGRDAIASMAYKVSQSKSALEALGKALADEAKEIPKKIDASRKEMKETLDAWRDEVRKPLDDWEAAQAAIEAKRLADEAEAERVRLAEIAARELQEQVDRDHELAVFMYADYLREKAEAEKQAIIDAENAAKAQKEREDQIAKEAAENARIEAEQAAAAEQQRIQDEANRKAQEAQLAVERAQKEKAEAEAAALRQQQESERAAAKAKQDAEDAAKAAQERAEREKQQAIEAERQRVAAENARIAAEALAREKDTANKNRVNNEILADLQAVNIDEATAKLIITAIAKGQIRNVKITY
jgi:hypothetical protein